MTEKEIRQELEFYTLEEMAKIMKISVKTLRNRLSDGVDHPPCAGRGKSRRFYKSDFLKWDRARLTHEARRAS